MRALLAMFALLGGVCDAQIHITATQYSEEARIAGLEGTVLLAGTKITRPLGLGLDELAAQAVARYSRENIATDPAEAYAVEFSLPEKISHWHLAAVEFNTPAGVARPTFARADYPEGPGIGEAAYDEAGILNVIGRAGEATLTFDIDEQGDPGNFTVDEATADVWGMQAARLVGAWRFHPGMKAGVPVAAASTVSLVWGPTDFESPAVARQVKRLYSPPGKDSPPGRAPQYDPLPEAAIVSQTEPEYTEAARQAGVEGRAVFRMTVDPEGRPVNVVSESAPLSSEGGGAGAGLVQNARKAIEQWRFRPPGGGVLALTVLVNFQLSGVESLVFSQRVPAAAAPKPK